MMFIVSGRWLVVVCNATKKKFECRSQDILRYRHSGHAGSTVDATTGWIAAVAGRRTHSHAAAKMAR